MSEYHFAEIMRALKRIEERLSGKSQIKEYLSEQGKKGAAALTHEQRAAAGKEGGKARANNLPAKRRREIARGAAHARWDHKKDGPCKVS